MALIVQKYGGSSVATAERIRAVAQRIAPPIMTRAAIAHGFISRSTITQPTRQGAHAFE